jgi:FAD-dependent oxidoreductase domain-containing protein 1
MPENIQMSLYGAEFLRNVKQHLGEEVEVNFTPHGYLVLATEEGAAQLEENSKLQNILGAKNELLTAAKLKRKFPWLNTDGIALGCHGLEKEGWFDPYALLCGLRKRAVEHGAHYVDGEAIGFDYKDMHEIYVEGAEPGTYKKPEKLYVKMKDGEIRTIKFAYCIVAAGAYSADVAKMVGIGCGSGLLSIPLPVGK